MSSDRGVIERALDNLADCEKSCAYAGMDGGPVAESLRNMCARISPMAKTHGALDVVRVYLK